MLGDGASHEVVRRIHANTRVGSRYLAIPLDQYQQLTDFTAANNAYIEAALELGVEAVNGALAAAGIAPDEVDVIMSTSVTGIAVPSLEARIAARVGFRRGHQAGAAVRPRLRRRRGRASPACTTICAAGPITSASCCPSSCAR